MTDDIEKEIEALRKLKKPYQQLTYDQISKLVNTELSKLERDFTSADLREIDLKLGLPNGTSFEVSGMSDFLQFGEGSED